jgi:TonB family protein
MFAALFGVLAVVGEEHPRACKAIDQLVQAPGCRVSECRLGGFSTVLLGSEAGIRFETRGDLVLLDRECDAKSSIPDLFAKQKKSLQDLGFVVEGSEQVQQNYGAIVFQKNGQWLELTGLLLEGAPSLSIRSVRTDGKTQARRLGDDQPIEAAKPQEVVSTALSVSKETTPAVAPELATASGSDQDRQPRIVARTEAVVPAGLEQAAVTGITVEVALDEKGSIARILSTKGNPALLASALQAVRNWTFEPALASGKPVPGVLQLEVSFKNRR